MRLSRRGFLKHAAAASAVTGIGVNSMWAQDKAAESEDNGKLRFAQVGCGGRGKAHHGCWRGHKFVAACDTDRKTLGMFSSASMPDLHRYTDYRELIEKEADNLDAIIVATPDHNHYAVAMLALQAGIPVFCEKPLAWSVQECLDLAKVSTAKKIPTQMGNQGNARSGWRQIYSIVHSDIIGKVESVHTWTNRPVWPQGNPKSDLKDEIPEKLDWDSWIGVAPMRNYREGIYHGFNWRGFLDFGCGALGDMACHTMNAMFQVMKPEFDLAVEPVLIEGATDDQFPNAQIIKWSFKKAGACPGFDAFWYDGDKKPEKPEMLGENNLPRTGSMFIGTKGVLISASDYNDNPVVYVDGQVVKPEFEQMIENSPGMYAEWIQAIKGEKPWDFPKSSFSYAGKITAIINTGIVSQRLNRKLEFSAKKMKFNDADANKLMSRIPREGWEKAYRI